MIHSLERRRLLAAPPSFPIAVNGTSGSDNISITLTNGLFRVTNNGVIKDYKPSGVQKFIVKGLGGNDIIKADNTVYKLIEAFGGDGNDSIVGGAAGDILAGGNTSTTATAEQGTDTILGNNGNDTIASPKFGRGILNGGEGNDGMIGGTGADDMNGANGNDTLMGNAGNDVLRGNAGYDSIIGSTGNDTIEGGTQDDILIGDPGGDSMRGGEGNDNMLGGTHSDIMHGDGGNDTIRGETGLDSMTGGLGADMIDYFERGANQGVVISQDGVRNDGVPGELDYVEGFEILRGGAGPDTITGSSGAESLFGNDGNDIVHGGGGNDYVFGGVGNDAVYGDTGLDTIYGEAGNDRLYGGASTDYHYGGAGDDTIISIGGGQSDRAFGQSGYDSFWIDAENTEQHDADADESKFGHVHRVGVFFNGASRELDGQDLPDPSPVGEAAFLTAFDSRPLFSSAGPMDTDVKQGGVGDCYFLAGLAAIAQQYPEKIRESVVDLGDGTYAVQYKAGAATAFFRVDSELPVAPTTTSTPYFAKLGPEGAMWVAIMEKAYCLYKSNTYAAISGGEEAEPFNALGMTNANSWAPTADLTALLLKTHLDLGRAVTCDTPAGTYLPGMHAVPSHVYQVQSVTFSSSVYHITVRNPWGSDTGRQLDDWTYGANDGVVTFTAFEFHNLFEGAWWGETSVKV